MPVSAGKKKAKKPAVVINFEGCCKIGPNPCPALMAQNNKANAAIGKKNALNTKSFFMLSTPKYTIYIFNNQNKTNVMAGPVCNPHEDGKIGGKVSNTGNHNRNI